MPYTDDHSWQKIKQYDVRVSAEYESRSIWRCTLCKSLVITVGGGPPQSGRYHPGFTKLSCADIYIKKILDE